MKWEYDDGGREAAGYKGKTGDCVARAIAIALELPYQQVYDELAAGNAAQRKTKRACKASGRKTAAHGISVRQKWFKDWMIARGCKWVPAMSIGSGCQVHLRADELPGGRIIVQLSRHMAAVIDGVVHDTYDCTRDGTRCVYGYWILS